MQRLYSMFPAGSAGAALLVLRLCVVASVVLIVQPLELLVPPMVSLAVATPVAIALLLGALTPVSCAIVLLIQVSVLAQAFDPSALEILIHGGMALALLMLGPGAYSVDSRLFGRRLVLPNHDEL